MKAPHACLTALSLAALGGCATSPTLTAPAVPANLNPPAGQVMYLVVPATGVQIYECAPKAAQAGAYEWSFRAPEAILRDTRQIAIGKHYAGPTWEGNDGSKAVGVVKERDPGPDASAIPWLLLEARTTSGTGIFADAKYVQRVATAGGVAPSTGCGAANVKEVARVPYTATYYFYRAGTGY
jgi:Protein of unknown function (DUF3455)